MLARSPPYVQSEKNGTMESIAEYIVWSRWELTRKSCLGMTPFADRSVTTSRGAWILAGTILAATVLLGNFELLSGRTAPTWDAVDYFAPLFSLIADHAKAGRLMLWNPWVNAGSPDFSDPQVGASSPLLLLFALIVPNPFFGFLAYWMALWIAGGLGMMLLCRHLKAPRLGRDGDLVGLSCQWSIYSERRTYQLDLFFRPAALDRVEIR